MTMRMASTTTPTPQRPAVQSQRIPVQILPS